MPYPDPAFSFSSFPSAAAPFHPLHCLAHMLAAAVYAFVAFLAAASAAFLAAALALRNAACPGLPLCLFSRRTNADSESLLLPSLSSLEAAGIGSALAAAALALALAAAAIALALALAAGGRYAQGAQAAGKHQWRAAHPREKGEVLGEGAAKGFI